MIRLNRAELSDALDAAAPITKAKSPIPVLKNVLLVSHGKSLRVAATNLETSLVQTLTSDGDQFSTLAPCAELAKIVSSLAGDEIELKYDDTKKTLTIGSGKSKYVFRCLSPDDFPTLPKVAGDQNGRTLQVKVTSLTEAFNRTRGFVDDQPMQRWAFGGVYVEFSGTTTKVAAASGAMASVFNFASDANGGAPAILSPESVSQAIGLLAKTKVESVEIAISDRHWSIKVGQREVIGRLMEGQFPDISTVTDGARSSATATVTVGREEIISACRRLESLRGDTLGIKVEAVKDGLQLSYANKDIGDGIESVAAKVEGTFKPIGFKSYQLTKVFGAASGAEVTMRLPSDGGAAVFTEATVSSGSDWTGMVASVKV